MNKFCRAANEYLDERTGTYEFRCRRYRAVLNIMKRELGFGKFLFPSTVADIGAGRCEFGMFLRHKAPRALKWYYPFDAAIDGVNLARTIPLVPASFYVAIEFLEHLEPYEIRRYLYEMPLHARIGAVITTPNPATTDVLAMDKTHKTPITKRFLENEGWKVVEKKLFTTKKDTLVAWKEHQE